MRSSRLPYSLPRIPDLVNQIGEVFWNTFGQGCSMDIMFVDQDQEARLASVCKPFYTARRE